MTIAQLRDLVYFKYMKECERRGIPEVEIGNGEFKVYYDIALDEMMKKLKLTTATTDISLTAVTSYTEYALPSTYGGYINHEIVFSGNSIYANKLELKDISEMTTGGTLISSVPNSIAIFPKIDGLYYVYLYPLAGFSGTLTIRYKYATPINAGGGADVDLTGDVILPSIYIAILMDGILSQIFPDLRPAYEVKLRDSIYLDPVPTKGETTYNLGGFDDVEDFEAGFSKNFRGEY